VIPARGGSKRIPRKNIKPFRGKPMIAWSIAAARRSKLFDHVIVSTDDAEIAGVARGLGAEVPFTRPAELSDDHAGTIEVIAHATQWAKDQLWPLEAVCCIYPTAPFLEIDDLATGASELRSGGWDYALPATDFPAPIFRSFRKVPDGGIEMFFPEYFTTRSQDLPAALHDAGQFYWGKPSSWLEGVQDFGRRSYVIEIPRWRVHDLDTPDDWIRAELVHQALFPEAEAA
jgi:N-acylneuraminate cytidylyltransferase